MLLAASESAVTKKPRLRLTMRRSSSVRPLGSFHVAMSRDMLISCGIQWFAQVARYFSHAHLYLNGTSWLTSVWPLMMRLSATLTRRWFDVVAIDALGGSGTLAERAGEAVASAGTAIETGDRLMDRASRGRFGAAGFAFVFGGRTSSSQTSMCVRPNPVNYRNVASKHQALLDIGA